MSITRLTTNGLTGTKYDTVSADNYYMEPIATTLLTGTQATITFSGIPQNYKHLQIRMIGLTDDTANSGIGLVRLSGFFNGDTTQTNYYNHNLRGDGQSAAAGAENAAKFIGSAVRNSMIGPAASVTDILDYANVYKFKTIRCLTGYQNNDADGAAQGIRLVSGLWSNTAAITSIQFVPESGNFKANTRIALYGIKG